MMNVQIVSSAYDPKIYNRVGSAKPAASGSVSAKSTEKVEISSTSSELQSVQDTLKALPDVRLELVENIKQRIRINDYPLENNLDKALKNMMSEILNVTE